MNVYYDVENKKEIIILYVRDLVNGRASPELLRTANDEDIAQEHLRINANEQSRLRVQKINTYYMFDDCPICNIR
jgi:hypothetical protein